jgi:hypothetical protein
VNNPGRRGGLTLSANPWLIALNNEKYWQG